MCNNIYLAILLLLFGPGDDSVLGPNAPEENRTKLAKLLRAATVTELQGKVFKATDSQDIKAEKLGVEVRLGSATVTAEASCTDPLKNLSVTIPDMRRKGKLEVRTKCNVRCPFSGKVHGEVLGIGYSIPFQAKASLSATADVKFSTDESGKVLIEPTFTEWEGNISDIDFKDEVANAVFSGLAEEAVNDLLKDNRASLMEDANAAVKQAAQAGKLSADPGDLFK